MKSVFREKREYNLESNPRLNWNPDKDNYIHRTHDEGIPRVRIYSLNSILCFTQYKGFTIKKLIETNFNYFTWLPRNIENFIYTNEVLKYANTCLKELEKIENYPINKTNTELGKAIDQVEAMTYYEDALDSGKDKYFLMSLKLSINVEYYKTIINTRIERLIRQTLETEQNSSEYRRKYFEEIQNKNNYLQQSTVAKKK